MVHDQQSNPLLLLKRNLARNAIVDLLILEQQNWQFASVTQSYRRRISLNVSNE